MLQQLEKKTRVIECQTHGIFIFIYIHLVIDIIKKKLFYKINYI